jgi:hypothetical protein
MTLPVPLSLIEHRSKQRQLVLATVYVLFLLQGLGAILVVLSTGILWLILLGGLVCVAELAFCVYLLKMNRDPELILTATGFSERTETDFRQFNWSDIERFEVYSFKSPQHLRVTRVGITFSDLFRQNPDFKQIRLTARTERRLTGYDWHLSNFYGESPDKLADLLNRYRQYYAPD